MTMSRKYVEAGISKIALSNARFYTTSLRAEQFRLLYYDAGTDTWSFQTHTLGEAPPYVAISYTWGPNEDTNYANDDPVTQDGVPGYLSANDSGQETTMNEDSEYSLQIEGQTYAVSRNVYELATATIDRTIVYPGWIDALCINQADVEERNSQVSNMAQIFGGALYVLTWLGSDDLNEADVVIDMCRAIQAEYNRQIGDGGRDASARRNPNIADQGVVEAMGLPPLTDNRWHVLAKFFDRRWFHRVWIIQEMVMAKDCQYLWGATLLEERLLLDVSSFILQSEFPLSGWRQPVDPDRKTYRTSAWYTLGQKIGETMAKTRAFSLVVWRDPNETDGQPYMMDSYDRQMDVVGGQKMIEGQLRQDCMRHWANMLETNRTFDATDPRDHIYATQGIINTAADTRGWTKTGIEIDYTKSVAEVYADATKRIMEASKCLNLLSLAQDPQMRRQHTLPSWVPDFSSRGEMPILLSRPRRWRLMPHVYNMAKGLSDSPAPVFIIQDDLRTLHVKAIHLDTISKIGESHHQFTNGGMFEQISEIILSRDSFARNESRVESLWRTMIANTAIADERIVGSEVAALFKSFVTISLVLKAFTEPGHLEKLPKWQRLTEIHRAECNDEEDLAMLPSFEYLHDRVQFMNLANAELEAGGTPLPQGPKHSEAGVFAGATQPVWYRRVLLTSSGFLGFGPMSTKPGDEVWLLPGMPLPTILRRKEKEGQYTVLGECYLHGDPNFSDTLGAHDSRWIDLV